MKKGYFAAKPVETNLEVKNRLLFLSVFTKVYGLMFLIHSPTSDVFLSYLVTSFQKQTVQDVTLFLGLSRK